jgi:membrane fusion protein (multidrug efflux system)
MQARKQETEKEPAGPVGQPLDPPFREKPLVETEEAPIEKKKKTWLLIPLVILVVLGAYQLAKFLTYSRSHVTTDNAFLSADITLVAPQVSGTVEKIVVVDNQAVKAGQLLVVLDDSTYQANLAQAQANLSAAVAAKQAAEADLVLSQKTSSGQLAQANGGVQQAQGGVAQAEESVVNADAAVSGARAQEGNTAALTRSSQAALQTSIVNRARAIQAVDSAKSQVNAADATLRAAQANVKSAQAHQTYAASQAKRFQSLAAQGAVSAQQAESAQQDLDTAIAALQAAEDQVTTARANLEGRRSDLKSAQQGVPIAESAISQAKATVSALQQQHQISVAQVQHAMSNRASMAQGIQVAKGKASQAAGQQLAANTVSQVVASKQAAAQQAAAKVKQAQAALKQAELDSQRTKIYAPVDGVVGNRAVDQGSLVQPGVPLMSVVRAHSLYVDVNLKETQTADLRAGQEAEIDVDGFPAHPFHGHLTSLSPATGATFALLPPDNASGNFVKVVQRIPVRVGLDAGQPDLDRLKPGMSASVSIRTK